MARHSEITISLRWSDLDELGHVNHVASLGLLAEMRRRWFRAFAKIEPAEFVIARLEVEFLDELTLADDPLHLELRVANLGRRSVQTEERILSASKTAKLDTRTTLVLWNAATRSPRELTNAEREALKHGQVEGVRTVRSGAPARPNSPRSRRRSDDGGLRR